MKHGCPLVYPVKRARDGPSVTWEVAFRVQVQGVLIGVYTYLNI